MIYLSLKSIFLIIIIIINILWILLSVIKYKIDRKYKKNCFECKYYKLHSVASCGGRCRYKCTLKNTYCNHGFNDRVKLTKCENFENK